MATEDGPNPLFLKWVKEWWDEAKERNTMGVLAYRSAYESLKACPIRFNHPDELIALRGFGPKLCSRLKEKLTQHCAENGLRMLKKRGAAQISKALGEAGVVDEDQRAARTASSTTGTRKRKAYVPALRQGGYAIVMALSSPEVEGRQWMGKQELIELAQQHCDTSFTVKPPGKFYTAWDSIRTLLNNDLVMERGRPSKRYALTEEGWEIARRFRRVVGADAEGAQKDTETGHQAGHSLEDDLPLVPISELVPDGPVVAGEDGLPEVSAIELPAGSFSVQLVLDSRERVSGQRTYMEDELGKQLGGQKPAVRSLTLGDALWVAKCHDGGRRLSASGAEGDEVVLDWLVERKRQDDLISSIRDGRFREQKFRQRRSGVRHVVYVVEDGGLDADGQFRHDDAMRSAVTATQAVHGCFVKRTRSVDDTIAYLTRITQQLQRRYADRPLRVIPTAALTAHNHLSLLARERERAQVSRDNPEICITYAAFASLTSKSDTLTLRDVFLKMLMCTRGVTAERALEIQKRWPTPHVLVQAYANMDREADCTEDACKRKRTMVSDVLGQLPGNKRRVSKVISEKLAEAWADA